MRTDLQREREEQRRWRLRPQFSAYRSYDTLVANEFLSEDEQKAGQVAALHRLLRFAATSVPFYADLFAKLGKGPEHIKTPDDLSNLPLLTKGQLQSAGHRLRARQLPRGEKVRSLTSSSGTTGQPARVLHTHRSNMMFTLLSQRHYRWFRFDPQKRMAFIRVAHDLPPSQGGGKYADGVTCRLPAWRYVGLHFETGPWFGLTMTTPVDRQLAWLREIGPSYFASHASWLEHLTYAAQGRKPVDTIESTISIVEQLSAPMRARVERTFATAVHEAYGMNEIGLVAVRCAAGRFHVHSEHCIVEIVDQDGQPCKAGETGRLVVTGLRNAAMPLIRYDVDDQAEVPQGPCPCGRTLPSFANLFGRYRRHAALPEGSYPLFSNLRAAVDELPDDLSRNLRQLQIHQYRDHRFELRLATAAPLPKAAHDFLNAAWRQIVGDRPERLSIVEVEGFERPPNGKFQSFTSDYMPDPNSPLPEP